MAKEKVNMPMSGAGILGVGSDSTSLIQLRPTHVVVLIVIVAILVLALHMFGATVPTISG